MKFLVAGGAGFLGSHLCEKLIDSGNQVICLDNLSTGDGQNISHLLDNRDFSFEMGDVTNLLEFKVDGIFNLACPASPVQYKKSPVQTLKTSVFGSINLLELASRTGARILQASTSEVYGDPKVSPQSEDYWGNVNPIGIRSCYDEGKRAAETAFFDFHRQFSTDIRVARIFNTYGPRMAIDDGRVVSNFILQSLENLPITVYGDGSQTRSFCYVDDLTDGLIKLFHSEDVFFPVNLGNPEPITMIDLAHEIIELTNSNSKIHFKKLPEDDPTQRKPSIETAARVLSWSPRISRETGLIKTIDYFSNLKKARK